MQNLEAEEIARGSLHCDELSAGRVMSQRARARGVFHGPTCGPTLYARARLGALERARKCSQLQGMKRPIGGQERDFHSCALPTELSRQKRVKRQLFASRRGWSLRFWAHPAVPLRLEIAAFSSDMASTLPARNCASSDTGVALRSPRGGPRAVATACPSPDFVPCACRALGAWCDRGDEGPSLREHDPTPGRPAAYGRV
jgi:hypothetical protein